MSSAICYNLDQSKILSSGYGLLIQKIHFVRQPTDMQKICGWWKLSVLRAQADMAWIFYRKCINSPYSRVRLVFVCLSVPGEIFIAAQFIGSRHFMF